MPDDEAALTADIIALATQYGRYGYRRIAAMLWDAGGVALNASNGSGGGSGLKVPQKQPKKGRLWLNDGSCIRLRPERPTHNGRKYRMLNIIDECTRECLAIRVNRKLNSNDVIDVLSDLFILRGIPGHIVLIIAISSSPRPSASGSQWSAQRRPISNQEALGRTVTVRASTRSSVTNCSMVKSSTRWKKQRSIIESGDAIITLCARTLRLAIGHRRPRSSSPRTRLRNPDQLRRPRSRWCRGQT